MTIRLTRRGAIAFGPGTLKASALGRPVLAAASEFRIGWQQGAWSPSSRACPFSMSPDPR